LAAARFPLTHFSTWLAQEGVNPASSNQYVSRVRAILNATGANPEDDADVIEKAKTLPGLEMYLSALSPSTRLVTNTAWGAYARFLRQYGITIPLLGARQPEPPTAKDFIAQFRDWLQNRVAYSTALNYSTQVHSVLRLIGCPADLETLGARRDFVTEQVAAHFSGMAPSLLKTKAAAWNSFAEFMAQAGHPFPAFSSTERNHGRWKAVSNVAGQPPVDRATASLYWTICHHAPRVTAELLEVLRWYDVRWETGTGTSAPAASAFRAILRCRTDDTVINLPPKATYALQQLWTVSGCPGSVDEPLTRLEPRVLQWVMAQGRAGSLPLLAPPRAPTAFPEPPPLHSAGGGGGAHAVGSQEANRGSTSKASSAEASEEAEVPSWVLDDDLEA
jgi:hypothetical protein